MDTDAGVIPDNACGRSPRRGDRLYCKHCLIACVLVLIEEDGSAIASGDVPSKSRGECRSGGTSPLHRAESWTSDELEEDAPKPSICGWLS